MFQIPSTVTPFKIKAWLVRDRFGVFNSQQLLVTRASQNHCYHTSLNRFYPQITQYVSHYDGLWLNSFC